MPKKKRHPRQPVRRTDTTATRQASEPAPDRADADEFYPLRDRYPTVQDAVQAAEAGEDVEWQGDIEGLPMRHRLVLTGGQPVIEQAVLTGWPLDAMIRCAWLQSDTHANTEKAILATLNELHEVLRLLLEEEIRAVRPDYDAAVLTAFAEPTEDGGLPTFGWRARYPVTDELTWADACDTAAWNMSVCFDAFHPAIENVPEVGEQAMAARLRGHGAPLFLCRGCHRPLTDRHPRWTGVWAAPEGGPLCESAGEDTSPDDDEFGHPHQPATP
ncbi:hypothetical protein [Streptomyces glycanivorans]|uniref:Uncharacterized protein n=1 Tax=Streptomyces glycanivorans TaxID=3033808 RepID=A0ABY9JTT6_9ACTN|nr:hypothetical protein [Streptomyces sp. Alt3]WLQ69387.1 hypothetical protein P8A20_38415 [Streptomyces sp. Alt3]